MISRHNKAKLLKLNDLQLADSQKQYSECQLIHMAALQFELLGFCYILETVILISKPNYCVSQISMFR